MDEYAEWFGARLRAALGDTPQTDLVELMKENGFEITPGRLSHYMQGRRYPDPAVLRELARALGVSSDWLLGLTEQSMTVADLEEMLAQAKGEGRINKIMRNLTPDQQQDVLQYAEYLWARRNASSTPPAPNNGRTREEMQAEIVAILDSVERHYGVDERRRLERIGLNKTGAVNASV